MLSNFFAEMNDIFEEYQHTLGFKIYLTVVFSLIPTLYIFLNILSNNKIDPLVYFFLLAFIETLFYIIMPFHFYRTKFGNKIIFEDPHRYKRNERLDKIKLTKGNNINYSFKIKFGKKVIEYLEQDKQYKIKFKKPKNVKIIPFDRENSEEKWHNHPDEPFLNCIYDMDMERTFYFKIFTTHNENYSKFLFIYFEYGSKKIELHNEPIEIVN